MSARGAKLPPEGAFVAAGSWGLADAFLRLEMQLKECGQQRPLLDVPLNDHLQTLHGSIEMGRLQIAAHHLVAQKHAEGSGV